MAQTIVCNRNAKFEYNKLYKIVGARGMHLNGLAVQVCWPETNIPIWEVKDL